jgi:predicted RNase H-like HicB family nuclease
MADILEEMRENPAYGWRMADIQIVCDRNGVMCKPPKGGGSHYKVFHGSVAEILTVPFKRPIKPVYIRKLVAFIDALKGQQMTALQYPVLIEPLAPEDGGGFLARVPDLPGCMSDGDTPEEAIANIQNAISVWLEAAEETGQAIPKPSRPSAIA